MKWYIPLLFLFFYASSFAQEIKSQRSQWLIDKIFDLETKVDASKTEIEILQTEIQKRDISISKSENIIRLTKQSGNIEAEKIARQANQKAKEVKQSK